MIVVKGNGPLSPVTTKERETKREGWRGRKQTSFLFSRHSQGREEGEYLTEERGEGSPLETRERERERESAVDLVHRLFNKQCKMLGSSMEGKKDRKTEIQDSR